MLRSLLSLFLCLLTISTLIPSPNAARAASGDYDIGTPTLRDVWVSTSGSDETGDGASRETAFASLYAAWVNIPSTPVNGTGYRIRLTPGSYRGAYLESWTGTAQFPIVIEPGLRDEAKQTLECRVRAQDGKAAEVTYINFIF